jgi:hypothetical protein
MRSVMASPWSPALAAAVAVVVMMTACAPTDIDAEETPATAMAPTPSDGEPEVTRTPTLSPEATAAAPAPAAAWEPAIDAPVALTEVAGAAHDGRLWIAGGYLADGSASAAVLVYDPTNEEWTDGPALPDAVHHAVLVSTGDQLILLGGFRGAGFDEPIADVWILAPAGNEWTAGPALPSPRGAGAAAWDGERILYAGGVGPQGVVSDVYALDREEWEPLGQMSQARQHLAATSDGVGRVWILAGRHSSLDTNTGLVEIVSGTEITPLEVELTPRSGVGAFWLAGTGACLVGGEAPHGTEPLVECVTDANEIVELPSLRGARHGLGVAAVGDAVYAAAGGEQPGLYVSAMLERLPVE